MLDLNPYIESFGQAALDGLMRPRKMIQPKFLYDQRGSALFEKICQSREYYVTRVETEILQQHAREIAEEIGAHALIFEFGSGASQKTRILLNEIRIPAGYVPIDISREFLLASSKALKKEFPDLTVVPVYADFTRSLPLMHKSLLPPHHLARIGFFPGSTIGNFSREEAAQFLQQTARFLGSGGLFLVGVDLLKDRAVLEPAYNDSAGITAEFNLNLLERMRRELGANIDQRTFKHRAFFNSQEGRIEMHLVSQKEQQFELLGNRVRFAQGESIHTECSYKYEPAQFESMAKQSGYRTRRRWSDPKNYFAVYLLEVGT